MQLLTARELRQTLKISRTTLYRLLQKGLPSVGAGRLRRFELDTVLRWMNGRGSEADEITLMRAGMYRCTNLDGCQNRRTMRPWVWTFHRPVPSDKFYCQKCFSRELAWVGTPYAEPNVEATGERDDV